MRFGSLKKMVGCKPFVVHLCPGLKLIEIGLHVAQQVEDPLAMFLYLSELNFTLS